MRKWGKWVTEIRIPGSREKIWLGSYKTAEQAARAYDVARYCLGGPTAKLNFPNSVPDIPSASSLSRQQIQHAAAKYALYDIPSTSPSLQNIKKNSNKAREKPASPSRPSSVSETEVSCDSQQISEAQDLGLWESPFDENGGLNLEKIPSIDEVSAALELNILAQEGYPYIFLESTELWNFGYV